LLLSVVGGLVVHLPAPLPGRRSDLPDALARFAPIPKAPPVAGRSYISRTPHRAHTTRTASPS
jgi:hypothetical protein